MTDTLSDDFEDFGEQFLVDGIVLGSSEYFYFDWVDSGCWRRLDRKEQLG